VARLQFFKTGRFAWGTSLGLAMGGVVGILVAVFVVKQLPLHTLRWLVMIVVAYAAFSMLRSAMQESVVTPAAAPAPADGL
jgi:uncharacterized membrane protein YfcA